MGWHLGLPGALHTLPACTDRALTCRMPPRATPCSRHQAGQQARHRADQVAEAGAGRAVRSKQAQLRGIQGGAQVSALPGLAAGLGARALCSCICALVLLAPQGSAICVHVPRCACLCPLLPCISHACAFTSSTLACMPGSSPHLPSRLRCTLVARPWLQAAPECGEGGGPAGH